MLCFFLGGHKGQIQQDVLWPTGGRFCDSKSKAVRLIILTGGHWGSRLVAVSHVMLSV
jgi:hypothetical protein